jgi:hydrogenase maturation protease
VSVGRPLLIGVGSLDAGDDAAGLLVARQVRGAAGFDVAECAGVAADLVRLFEGRNRVLVVDACRSGAATGSVLRLDGLRDPLPAGLSPTSTHGMGVAEAVGLAQALGMAPAKITIWAIEGADFSLGAPLDPAVASAVARCADEAAHGRWEIVPNQS